MALSSSSNIRMVLNFCLNSYRRHGETSFYYARKFDGCLRTFSHTAIYKQQQKVTESEDRAYGYGVSGDMMQGVQGPYVGLENHTMESLGKLENPVPQGIQGHQCEQFKLWFANCSKYNFLDCDAQLEDLKHGRKTLGEIFAEQEQQILRVVNETKSAQQVGKDLSNAKSSGLGADVGLNVNVKVSAKDKLKKAVSQYGSTVIVFHVTISLISLGGFYLAVSSGIDVVSLLQKIGVGQTILESRLATGASTFVVAYAVHKVFAPVRIATTLTCTPFIVRYLRKIGFLKPPKSV